MPRFIMVTIFILISQILQAQCTACFEENDVIVNGNFSDGNTGFSTDLNPGSGFFCPLCPEGTYALGTYAFFFHSDFIGQDHTTGSGDFFIANAAAQEGINIWCQTVTVAPQTDYTFSFWVRDVTNNSDQHPLAILQANFNGTLVGSSIQAYGGWQENTFVWNSGTETTVDICIQNFQSNPGGNDFGLDDISMTACEPITLLYTANAGADVVVCSGESIQIGSTNHQGYNYTWNNGQNLSSISTSSPTFSYINSSAQDVVFNYEVTTDSAGVGCITTDIIQVTVRPAFSFSLGNDLQICPGETYTLNAGDTWDSVVWSDNSTSSTYSSNVAQTVEAIVTLYGCELTDELTISQVSLPSIDLGPDQAICESNIPLTIDAGVIGDWSTGVTASSIEVSQSGTFIITYQFQNCNVSDEINITVDTQPEVQIPDNVILCEGSTITLTSNLSGTWSNGTVGTSTVVSEPGIYSIQVVNGECTDIDGSTVTLMLPPTVDLGPDVTICDDQFASFDATFSENTTSYSWSNQATASMILVNEPGIYEVTLENACGTASDEVALETTICGWNIFVPSAFTPNGDEINDAWSVKGYNVSNLKVTVYNRFGDMIWETEAFEDEWRPDPLQIGDDAYNYRIEGITYLGENIVQHGYVRLLK